MMYWSERHGQVLEDDMLAVLFMSTAVLYFVIHHLLPAEEPLQETEEMLAELERLKSSEGRARTLREALFIVDMDKTRPAVYAAAHGKNRSLLVHRKRLTRSRGCVFINFVMMLSLVIEMLLAASRWQDWLFNGSFTYQVMFAIAAGHYANLLWEDLDSCGNFLPGFSRFADRLPVEKFALLVVSWLRNATCFAIFLMGAALWLPGLGVATLLWEAPLYLLCYREAWTSANQLAYWLLDEAALWQFWRPMLLLLLLVRVPLTLLLVISSVELEVANVEHKPETFVRAGYHVSSAVLIFENLLLMSILLREYRADQALAVKMRKLGYPRGISEGRSSKDATQQQEPDVHPQGRTSLARLFSFKGVKSGNSADETPQPLEQATSNVLPVCQLGELPSVPQEQDINVLNSMCVQSAPRSSQSEA